MYRERERGRADFEMNGEFAARQRSTSQKLTDDRSNPFGVGEVNVVTALYFRRLEVLDLFESRHHHILWKRPALQGSHRQHRTFDGGQERQRLVLGQPHS